MRSLTFVRPGRLEWRDVPAPTLEGAGEALVRPLAVARCDLDRAILEGQVPFRGALLHALRNHLPETIGQRRLFRNAPFKGPFAFGHEFVAEVVAVGDAVRTVRPGTRVAVSFQVCCGACDHCRRGLTANCSGVPPRSMYGFGDLGGRVWGGALSDVVRVPHADFMLVPLPQGIDPTTVASLPDNIVDGWRTVGPWLRELPGASVLVVAGGAHSIALYAAGLARALGASTVRYVDLDPARRAIAERFGAAAVAERGSARPEFDITVEASASAEGLSHAIRSTRPGGVCTSVGIYYTPTTPMPLLAMYGIGLRFIHGRVHSRPAMLEVLPAIADGRFHPEIVTTRTARWDDAPEALLDPGAKVVIVR